MSYIVFKGDGSVYKDWVSPILVNGIINDGGDPIDLTDLATRTWVTDQIKNAIKNGTLDLSAYATKSYVDQRISEIPGSGITKDYVDTQDASTLQSAKDYADGLVSSTGVSSLNGLTGAIRITPGSSNVSIASSEGQVSISVSGGGDGDPGQDGDTYRTFNIYQNTDSNEVIPSISSGAVPPTWDTVNNKLLNCPTG